MREIAKGIRYIGADDVTLDLFESQYTVPEGMSYNSYLIEDDKIAILDTADRRVGEAWFRNLEEALAGRTPDYLVVHHMEPDHSALIAQVAEKYPAVVVVASAKALQFLGQFAPGRSFNTLAVKEGDVLELGAHSLRFIAAPMVHWPEVMMSRESLTGVLFYQGEEDTGRTECYDVLLKAFISQLRRQFQNPALPFLNVQLPMWIPAGGTDTGTWPRLRQAQQRVAQEVSHTDLAILIDQGEYDNIHPTNKRVVGERLFFCAMNTVYGVPAPEAPRAVSKYTRDKTLYIQLSAPVTANGQSDLLLEVAGQDGVFYPAEAELDGSLLRLSHPNVPRPVMARYAWTDYASAPFFSENGLPLAPFWLV